MRVSRFLPPLLFPHIDKNYFQTLPGCRFALYQDVLLASSPYAHFAYSLFTLILVIAFVALLTRVSFGTPFGVVISRIIFSLAAPLSKNRVPLILAHVFEVLLKIIYLRNICLTFRARRVSPYFSVKAIFCRRRASHPAPRIPAHPKNPPIENTPLKGSQTQIP
jgi:hypothetical protein